MSALRARLLGWRAVRKGLSLRGFASIALPSGMVVHEVGVHVAANGRAWASPPSRPMLDRDGRQLRDDRGRGRWAPLIEFVSKDRGDAFSLLVLRLVAEEHGRDLDGWTMLAEAGL